MERKRKAFDDRSSLAKVHRISVSQIKDEPSTPFPQYKDDVQEIKVPEILPQTIRDSFDINQCFENSEDLLDKKERETIEALDALDNANYFYLEENKKTVITEQPHVRSHIHSQLIKLLPPTQTARTGPSNNFDQLLPTQTASQPIQRRPLLELAQCYNSTQQVPGQNFSKFKTGQKVTIKMPPNVNQSIKPHIKLLKPVQFATNSLFNFCKFYLIIYYI